MKKKIREFFDDLGLQTEKLVKRNKKGLNREQIEIGMKRVYLRMKNEPIKSLNIAREIWKEAETAQQKGLKDDDLRLEEEKIWQLTEDRDNYRTKFQGMLFLCGAVVYVFLCDFLIGWL